MINQALFHRHREEPFKREDHPNGGSVIEASNEFVYSDSWSRKVRMQLQDFLDKLKSEGLGRYDAGRHLFLDTKEQPMSGSKITQGEPPVLLVNFKKGVLHTIDLLSDNTPADAGIDTGRSSGRY